MLISISKHSKHIDFFVAFHWNFFCLLKFSLQDLHWQLFFFFFESRTRFLNVKMMPFIESEYLKTSSSKVSSNMGSCNSGCKQEKKESHSNGDVALATSGNPIDPKMQVDSRPLSLEEFLSLLPRTCTLSLYETQDVRFYPQSQLNLIVFKCHVDTSPILHARPSMRGWWYCHTGGHMNNPALAPERCSQCGHPRCPHCYVEPWFKPGVQFRFSGKLFDSRGWTLSMSISLIQETSSGVFLLTTEHIAWWFFFNLNSFLYFPFLPVFFWSNQAPLTYTVVCFPFWHVFLYWPTSFITLLDKKKFTDSLRFWVFFLLCISSSSDPLLSLFLFISIFLNVFYFSMNHLCLYKTVCQTQILIILIQFT